jgi:hypothetical protein
MTSNSGISDCKSHYHTANRSHLSEFVVEDRNVNQVIESVTEGESGISINSPTSPISPSTSDWISDLLQPDARLFCSRSKSSSPNTTILPSPSKTLRRAQLSKLYLPRLSKKHDDIFCIDSNVDQGDEDLNRNCEYSTEIRNVDCRGDGRRKRRDGDLLCRRLRPKFSGHFLSYGGPDNFDVGEITIELSQTSVHILTNN